MSQRIGVTGANGFVGRWVVQRLLREEGCEVVRLDRAAWDDASALDAFVQRCDAIVHLAGVNRGDDAEVERVNEALALSLTAACERTGAAPRIVYASTTKRTDDSPYGRGKLRAEAAFARWAERAGARQATLVVPNVYGAGCRPFYNSVVATFCHLLTHEGAPEVQVDAELDLIWVGDLADRLVAEALSDREPVNDGAPLAATGRMRVSEVLALLESFRDAYFVRGVTPNLTSRLHSTLYSTFQSHLEHSDRVRRPTLHADQRGDLCEVVRTDAGGQTFFSTTKPGVTRGDHYHTRKIEWFCVVRGEAAIRLRAVGDDRVTEYRVSGERPEFVSIPVMHTHSIENVGDSELLTLFWCNELFDPADADTFYEPVLPAATQAAA